MDVACFQLLKLDTSVITVSISTSAKSALKHSASKEKTPKRATLLTKGSTFSQK